MKAGQFKVRYIYKGRRIQWNGVNCLWWFYLIDDDGTRYQSCANTVAKAKDKIDHEANKIQVG